MKTSTQLVSLTLVMLLTGMTSHNALAQGRGGGGGGGGGGSGNMARSGAGPNNMSGQGSASGQGIQQRDRIRQRTQATEQQTTQLRTCDQSCLEVRKQTRSLIQATKQNGFNAEQAQTARTQLRDQIKAMDQEYDQLRQSLTDQQKTQLQDRLKILDRDRDQLHTRLKDLEAEIDKTTLDASRVRSQSRAVEKATARWHKQMRILVKEMGVTL